MERQKELKFDDGDVLAEVVVRRATFLDSFVRDQLVGKALQGPAPDVDDERAQALRTAAIVIWPAVKAVTEVARLEVKETEVELTLENLVGMPPELVNVWMQAIWELNPGWAPGGEPEKKA